MKEADHLIRYKTNAVGANMLERITTREIPKGKVIAQVEALNTLYEIIETFDTIRPSLVSEEGGRETFLLKTLSENKGTYGIAISADTSPITLLEKMLQQILEDYKEKYGHKYEPKEIIPFFAITERGIQSELQRTLKQRKQRKI